MAAAMQRVSYACSRISPAVASCIRAYHPPRRAARPSAASCPATGIAPPDAAPVHATPASPSRDASTVTMLAGLQAAQAALPASSVVIDVGGGGSDDDGSPLPPTLSVHPAARGVRLSWLRAQLPGWAAALGDPQFTTAALVAGVVVPATADARCRYTELLPPAATAPAAAFVSHAWARPFAELVDNLTAHFADCGGDAADDPAVWLDVFAVNQHAGPAQSADLAAFDAVIRSTGVLLVSLDQAGTPFRRVWCLYELLCALQLEDGSASGERARALAQARDVLRDMQEAKRAAELAVAEAEAKLAAAREALTHACTAVEAAALEVARAEQGGGSEPRSPPGGSVVTVMPYSVRAAELRRVFARLDLRAAEATKASDKALIAARIERSLGFTAAERRLREGLARSCHVAVERARQRSGGGADGAFSDALERAAVVLLLLGRGADALPLSRECLALRTAAQAADTSQDAAARTADAWEGVCLALMGAAAASTEQGVAASMALDAVAAARTTLRLNEAACGPTHARAIEAAALLARALAAANDRKQTEECVVLRRRVLAAHEATAPHDSRQVALARLQLASALLAVAESNPSGDEGGREALAHALKAAGVVQAQTALSASTSDDDALLDCMRDVCSALIRVSLPEEALQLARLHVERVSAVLGDAHVSYGEAMITLAGCEDSHARATDPVQARAGRGRQLACLRAAHAAFAAAHGHNAAAAASARLLLRRATCEAFWEELWQGCAPLAAAHLEAVRDPGGTWQRDSVPGACELASMRMYLRFLWVFRPLLPLMPLLRLLLWPLDRLSQWVDGQGILGPHAKPGLWAAFLGSTTCWVLFPPLFWAQLDVLLPALVVCWRNHGWHAPGTRYVGYWLGLVVASTLVSVSAWIGIVERNGGCRRPGCGWPSYDYFGNVFTLSCFVGPLADGVFTGLSMRWRHEGPGQLELPPHSALIQPPIDAIFTNAPSRWALFEGGGGLHPCDDGVALWHSAKRATIRRPAWIWQKLPGPASEARSMPAA